MGATFKEDVSDIRNSKVADIVKELKSYGVKVEVVDPHADSAELKHEYGFSLSKVSKGYDGVIVAVSHKEYKKLDEKYFTTLMGKKGVLVDIKGLYRGKIKQLNYWSL
jgi:UDP-N-acetyl-D-galactosamine dehydrogenase